VTRGDISGSAEFEVTAAVVQEIHVSPVDAKIAAGTTLQFTAVALLSDGNMPDVTTQVTWTSEHEDLATISSAAPDAGRGARRRRRRRRDHCHAAWHSPRARARR